MKNAKAASICESRNSKNESVIGTVIADYKGKKAPSGQIPTGSDDKKK